jgi:uncharacterized membrane protein
MNMVTIATRNRNLELHLVPLIFLLASYRELCYLSTTLGDFGGLFGLFLGGSAISVFEIFDLVIHIFATEVAKRAKRRQVKPQTPVNVVREQSAVEVNPMGLVNRGSLTITDCM